MDNLEKTVSINVPGVEYQNAKDLVQILRLQQEQGVSVTTDFMSNALEVCAKLIEKSDSKEQTSNAYDLSVFAKLLDEVCNPATVAALCVQSKSDLADIRLALESLDDEDIVFPYLRDSFNKLNSVLMLIRNLFISIQLKDSQQ